MTATELEEFRRHGSWRDLARFAEDMVSAVEEAADASMHPLLGGGTRLMLAYAHRISHDIDLFIRDPQWIGLLTPRLHEPPPAVTSYTESSNFIKFKLAEGEIDFVVAPSLYGLSPEHDPLTAFPLDPVKEVVGKKLLYRGETLTVRDLYDIWTVCRMTPDVFPPREAASLLGERLHAVKAQVETIKASRASSVAWDGLVTREVVPLQDVIGWADQWLDEAIGLNSSAREDLRTSHNSRPGPPR